VTHPTRTLLTLILRSRFWKNRFFDQGPGKLAHPAGPCPMPAAAAPAGVRSAGWGQRRNIAWRSFAVK